jgi:murein DD-endopeptidase MepM/ murein hydrolase activator NlpD
MNLPARLLIAVPSATALSILALYGADSAGFTADTPPSPPPVDDAAPVEPDPADPDPEEPEEPETPPPQPPEPLDFDHDAPGDVIPGTVHSQADEGVTDAINIAPDMRFPILTGPAYANSQLFNPTWSHEFYPHNGTIDGVRYERPQGWEYTPSNFAYPWVDNFCEIRTHQNGRCGQGIGHEGQDIRPGACWHNQVAVAAAAGQLRTLSNFSVDLFGDDGLVYRYFHLDRPLLVDLEPGEWVTVEAGDPIGFVSDVNRSGEPIARDTSIHLHFEIWEGDLNGHDPRSPYPSLVDAYRWLGAEDPANHEPFAEVGDCSYPDGGLTPTRGQVIAALEAAAAEGDSE